MGQIKRKPRHTPREVRLAKLEAKRRQEKWLKEALESHNNYTRKGQFSQMVNALFEGKPVRTKTDANYLILQLFGQFKKADLNRKRLFRDFLLFLHKKKCFKLLQDQESLMAIYNIARRSNDLIRDIYNWKPTSKAATKQLDQLLNYGFVRYDMPAFMNTVWRSDLRQFHSWYIELGLGLNPRKLAGLPITLTKKMAHLFFKAPKSLTMMSALRWAQVMAISNQRKLADILAVSYLGRNDFADEDYWICFIHLISNAQCSNAAKISHLLNYLIAYKQANPDATLKGRSLSVITNRADEWLAEQQKLKKARKLSWDTSGILPFANSRIENGQQVRYQIMELLSKAELYQEGKKMGHCVASYAQDCFKAETSIFSLRKTVDGTTTIEATIEVEIPQKMVVQAKAKFNNAVSKIGMNLIHKWSYLNGLFVDQNL